MRCVLCDTTGTLRFASMPDRLVFTVMCAAHELASVRAVASGDYGPMAEMLRWRHPEADPVEVMDTARIMATMRVIGLHETDRELIGQMLDAALSVGDDADDMDREWAVLDAMRKRGME